MKRSKIYAFIICLVLSLSLLSGVTSLAAAPVAPSISISTTTASNPKISWEKVTGASGYRVYRKTSTDSSYEKVITTKKLTFTDTKWDANQGTVIKYVVKAYKTEKDKTKSFSESSNLVKWTVPTKVTKGMTITPTPTPISTKTYSVMVWIPTRGGTKYHSKSSCSNMIGPDNVTIEQAKKLGFTPCGKCYK